MSGDEYTRSHVISSNVAPIYDRACVDWCICYMSREICVSVTTDQVCDHLIAMTSNL